MGIDRLFYSEKAREAGTVSRHEGGEKQIFNFDTSHPARAIFHHSRRATAGFLPATDERLLAVTPQTRRQQSTSCQHYSFN